MKFAFDDRQETPVPTFHRPSGTRYRILSRIATGGMGSIYLASQQGDAGFRRYVAVKRALPHLVEDPTFRRALLKEARLGSLVRHPNVVSVLDVEDQRGEILLVMEYVEGASLSELLQRPSQIPLPVIGRIIVDAAEGLDAIHACTDESGAPLSLVHRDVSPHNLLVGLDGITRVADFGIAQICGPTDTRSGLLRGKPSYMSPEYIETNEATPATDIFALGAVMWELLTGRRLFKGASDIQTIDRVRNAKVIMPSLLRPDVSIAIDNVVLKALERDPRKRFGSAAELALAVEEAFAQDSLWTSRRTVAQYVRAASADVLDRRSAEVLQEQTPTVDPRSQRSPFSDAAVIADTVRPPASSARQHAQPLLARLSPLLAAVALGLSFVALALVGRSAGSTSDASILTSRAATESVDRATDRMQDGAASEAESSAPAIVIWPSAAKRSER